MVVFSSWNESKKYIFREIFDIGKKYALKIGPFHSKYWPVMVRILLCFNFTEFLLYTNWINFFFCITTKISWNRKLRRRKKLVPDRILPPINHFAFSPYSKRKKSKHKCCSSPKVSRIQIRMRCLPGGKFDCKRYFGSLCISTFGITISSCEHQN